MVKSTSKLILIVALSFMALAPPLPANAEEKNPTNPNVFTQIINFGNWTQTNTVNNTVNNVNITNNTVNNSWTTNNTVVNSWNYTPTTATTQSTSPAGVVLSEENSREYLLKNDGNFITQQLDIRKGGQLRYRGKSNLSLLRAGWGNTFPIEEAFMYDVLDTEGQTLFSYLIGTKSQEVYCIPNQGGMAVYKVHDNKVIQAYSYLGKSTAYWRW